MGTERQTDIKRSDSKWEVEKRKTYKNADRQKTAIEPMRY